MLIYLSFYTAVNDAQNLSIHQPLQRHSMPSHSRRSILIIRLCRKPSQPLPPHDHGGKGPRAEERNHTHGHKSPLQALRRDPGRDGVGEAEAERVTDDDDDDHGFACDVFEAVDCVGEGGCAIADETECHDSDAEH